MVNIWINNSAHEVEGVININEGVSREKVLRTMFGNGLDEVLIEGKSGNVYLAYGTGIDTDEFVGADMKAPSLRISGRVVAVHNEINTGWEGFKDGWRWPVAMFGVGGVLGSGSYLVMFAAGLGVGAGGASTIGGVSFGTVATLSAVGIIAGIVIAAGGVVYGGYQVYKGASADANYDKLFLLGRELTEVEDEPASDSSGCSMDTHGTSRTGRAVDKAFSDAISEYKYALRSLGIF